MNYLVRYRSYREYKKAIVSASSPEEVKENLDDSLTGELRWGFRPDSVKIVCEIEEKVEEAESEGFAKL